MCEFQFLDPGKLLDKDLELGLREQFPGDPTKHYVPAYRFNMLDSSSKQTVGNVELRVGNLPDLIRYGGHFAYGVDEKARGRHYAERACRLLIPLAKKHNLNELWITCNPDNWPSRRTCERLGAELIEIVELPEYNDMYQRGERQKCRYRLTV